MIRNLARFVLQQADRRRDLRLGLIGNEITLGTAVECATGAAGSLEGAGYASGSRIAVMDANSTELLIFWIACQLAGVQVAFVNPTYPDDLLGSMLEGLRADAVATAAGRAPASVTGNRRTLGYAGIRDGVLALNGNNVAPRDASSLPGTGARPSSIAGYMHTSGTTGDPKFCAQSHEYFLRLGRFVADTMALSPNDRVLAPLPMFHVNPFGYGFLGALSGLSDALTVPKFSGRTFWPTLREAHVTVVFLHSAPAEILKRRSSFDEAKGHSVRAIFYADTEFLDRFAIPLGVSAYGSTEAGGISHTWLWRRGESSAAPEGANRVGGRARADIRWRLSEDGEIYVGEEAPGAMFSGYVRNGDLDRALDENGWFHTGDVGRIDELGRLVFIERRSESIRVKGEYVPVTFVERQFADIRGLEDFALWKRPSDLADDETVLYVVCDGVPLRHIGEVASGLPPFMRPRFVARVRAIPRDSATGKVQRRRLHDNEIIEWVALQ